MKIVGKVQQYIYTLVYRRGARRMVLRYDVHGSLLVTAPYSVSRGEVERFILESAPKLEKKKKPERSWLEGMEIYVAGKPCVLAFSPQALKPYVLGGKLFVRPGVRDEIQWMVKCFYSDELKRRVVPLVNSWCKRLQVSIGFISLRDSHRVWASCSARGDLNFSLRCAGLGDEDLSYLVLHELAHRVNFNHGPGFYEFLDRHMSDWNVREDHLRLMQAKCDIFD